jgi:hypothetical protein
MILHFKLGAKIIKTIGIIGGKYIFNPHSAKYTLIIGEKRLFYPFSAKYSKPTTLDLN